GLKLANRPELVSLLRVDGHTVQLLETMLPGSNVVIWLVDCPKFFDVEGNPYVDVFGNSYKDNAERFALFCRVAIEIAMNRAQLDWKADIVHCNDWQTGLIPALLSLEYQCPATVFTVHNMAYQGIFSGLTAAMLHLPGQLLSVHGLEFHGMISFLKGGIAYADKITTVSPTYAQDIQTPALGYGLEGLLVYRSDDLMGIINGIDGEWNPETDPLIAQNYTANSLQTKSVNKTALQTRLNLPVDGSVLLLSLISRLVEQKGIDMLLDCLPELLLLPVQIVILGSGDKIFEQRLFELAAAYPHKMALTLGYNETLAHQIEAGADVFLMPSRFEPCGLNQMYSQRYGTLPIVRHTGGLADTVVDTLPETMANHTATGFVFNDAHAGTLLEAVKRATLLHSFPEVWQQLQTNAMSRDFSWQNSAEQYLALYESIE
ncbi:MAG: glycogen synthase GlgA, partial [Methylococcales bacterium]|nr:glycogen synthase GlgA [Methylococcales bacterium]